MLELARPVDARLGCGRIEKQPQRRTVRNREIKAPHRTTVLAVIGQRILWWLSAVARSAVARGPGGRWSDTWRGSYRGRVGTGDWVRIEGGGVTDGRGGGGWCRSWMRGAGSLECRNHLLAADAFFVRAKELSVQAPAAGPVVKANRQTLRNRELGQLCQTQKWLKRYKTGMFANLANLANLAKQICKKSGSRQTIERRAEIRVTDERALPCGGRDRRNSEFDGLPYNDQVGQRAIGLTADGCGRSTLLRASVAGREGIA